MKRYFREAAGVAPKSVFSMLDRVFGDDLHAKTVLSLAMGAVGVLHAATLGIHTTLLGGINPEAQGHTAAQAARTTFGRLKQELCHVVGLTLAELSSARGSLLPFIEAPVTAGAPSGAVERELTGHGRVR